MAYAKEKLQAKGAKTTNVNVQVRKAEDVGKVLEALNVALAKSKSKDQVVINVSGPSAEPVEGLELL